MSLRRISLVVHPQRDIDVALEALREWAREHEVVVGQVPLTREQRQVAEELPAEESDLVVAIGGDGTTLAAIRAAAAADVPVLGIACGSLGVLTSLDERETGRGLDAFTAGDWQPRLLAALEVSAPDQASRLAFNDVVVVRAGEGQVRVAATVNGELFARFAGDGCVVATPLGSSAYTLAAGGPLLPLEMQAYVLTTLPAHGGDRPPLVLTGEQQLSLKVSAGFGGYRVELDGQLDGEPPGELSIRLRSEVAKVVVLPGQEGLIAGLRRRGVIADSPRILAEDARKRGHQAG